MAKITLNDVVSGYNLAAINENFDRIEAEFQNKVLYRDNPVGEANSMQNELDMNSKRLYNLAAPVGPNDALRLADIPTTPVGTTSAAFTTFAPTATIAAVNVQGAINESDTEVRALIVADAAALAASTGASRVGFIQTGTGAVARTLQEHERDNNSWGDFLSSAQVADVKTGAATLDLATALGNAIVAGSVELGDGTYGINTPLSIVTPSKLAGNGARTILKARAGFPADAILKLAPAAAQDPKGWIVEDFHIVNAGGATSAILLDISPAGRYVSKMTLRNIISDSALPSFFFELRNTIPNVDGLFTMVIEDTWSLNGFYLDNVGDSVTINRATTSGSGRGYYINQLPGASHMLLRDGNCTSSGGILVAHAFNLTIDNMQCECPAAYTGTGTGYITLQNGAVGAKIQGVRITNNNINTQGATNTTLQCVYLNDSDSVVIENNTLFTNATTGAHIVVDSLSTNTYIGNNIYFNPSGAEIAPIINDVGVGTMGIWKPATETTWTVGVLSFFKSRDGIVSLRGNLSGAASTVGQVITTLPVGFRPTTPQILVAPYFGALSTISISTAGVVTLDIAGQTGVNFDGLSFGTK